MAKVFPKGRDGIFYAWGYARGKRWTRSTGTTKRRDAERVAVELEAAAQREADEAAHQAASLGWALSLLMEALMVGGKASGTIKNVAVKAGHIVRLLGGGRQLSTLEPPAGGDVLSEYVKERVAEGAKRSTIAIEVSVLKMALGKAARKGVFRGNIRGGKRNGGRRKQVG